MNKLNLILHAHLPYVRHLEYPRFLEENWLFESINESYLPLLRVLNELRERDVPFRLSLCFSPTLLTMLQDAPLQERFMNYMNLHIELGEKEVKRTEKEDEECHEMAQFYLEEAKRNLELYEKLNRDIVTGFKELERTRNVELIATAATHAYLPLYKDYSTAIEAQIEMGIRTHKRVFGAEPTGFWLPESGYYPGLDEILYRHGIKWCQLPSQAVLTAEDKSEFGGYRPIELPSGLYGMARDWNISQLISDSKTGYPCDPDYRDFYRDIGYSLPLDYVRPYIHEPSVRVFTGYKYHAITSLDTNNKSVYSYRKAMGKTKLHTENFLYHIRRKGIMLQTFGIENPVINLAFDAEFFGHRWFEGIEFLKNLIEEASEDQNLQLTTPSDVLYDGGRTERLRINEISRSQNGGADTWLDGSNNWIYRHILKAIERMEELTHRFPDQGSLKGRFLNQASREVLLAMASDWPCIMHDNTSVTYASKRLRNHLGSFNVVYTSMTKNTVNTEWLVHAEKRNAIFPDIDYNLFDPDTRSYGKKH